jgi:hypothetical protein
MARATCTSCGNEFRWYGGRGMKLVNVKSPCCEAPAKGKVGTRVTKTIPSIMATVQRLSTWTDKLEWYVDGRRKIELINGCIYAWTFHVFLRPTCEVVDGWRTFVCADPKCTHGKGCKLYHTARIQDKDSKRLGVELPKPILSDSEWCAFPLSTQLMVGGIARSNNGIRTTWGIDTPQSSGRR